MPDVQPTWTPGREVTCHAGTAVTGGRFVRINGARVEGNPRVVQTIAGERPFGVAARDKGAGEKVMVIRKGIVGVTAGVALTAGQDVQSDANGQAIVLAAGVRAGTVVDDAGIGTIALIALD